MSKHSPGPWSFRDVSGAGFGIFVDVRSVMGEKFVDLVSVFESNSLPEPKFQIAYERWVQFPKYEWREMQEANGRLMAAAPDLLLAAQEAMRLIEQLEIMANSAADIYKHELRGDAECFRRRIAPAIEKAIGFQDEAL